MSEKRLWVVEYRGSAVPESRFFPDYTEELIEVVVSDQFFAVVWAEYDHLDRVVGEYPYCRISGHPADGRWVGQGGDWVYIYNATILQSETELWDALGLTPEKFGVDTWDDVDDDIVRDCVPTF